MNKTKPIQIFKPGKHVAMSGAALSFSESDLAATAAAYDPARYEAPIVVGHPKHNAPAYGWVGSLSFRERAGGEGASLEACPQQVDPAFAEMVGRGAFKKISASFYSPDSPSNPVPGVYYLRHVGFLGAQPPAVKGLRAPEFADGEQGVVEFADWGDRQNASLWRSLREWIIGKYGQDEADKVVPGYTVESLEDLARKEEPPELNAGAGVAAQFSEGADQVTPEEKAALEAENTRLKQELAASAARDKAAKTAAIHAGNLAFAEGLAKEGRLLPAHKEVAVAALDHIAGADNVIEFGEGDAKKPLAGALKDFLQALPKVVEFGEAAGAENAPAGTVEFAAPDGQGVDRERLELHYKAQAYQAAHPGTEYLAAVRAVL